MVNYTARYWITAETYVIAQFQADNLNPTNYVQITYQHPNSGRTTETVRVQQLQAIGKNLRA